jgi:hypothetical protein
VYPTLVISFWSALRPLLRSPPPELWICYSSISYYLFVAWLKSGSSHRHGFVCFAPGSPLHKCHVSKELLNYTSQALKNYRARTFLFLAFISIVHGRRLVLRVPHLNHPIVNKTIERLLSYNLIHLELYDDGFLGILDRPSVCKYLKPIFRSVCSWNISGWRLSDYTLRAIKSTSIKTLDIQSLSCALAVENLDSVPLSDSFCNLFILEAKYMDYQLLEDLIRTSQLDLSLDQVPYYYQHPWSIKQNELWPAEWQRNVLTDVPVEAHLASLISPSSHVITAMTSSVIFLCELVRQGLLSNHRITLLLRTSTTPSEYHNDSEPYSFIRFIRQTYHDVINLSVWLNGTVL